MRERAGRAAADVHLRQLVTRATSSFDERRREAWSGSFAGRIDAVRDLAAAIRQHALDHLDAYVEQFAAGASAAGMRVHFARDAAEARAICLEIAGAAGCRLCVKSKSMVTEEIGLVGAFEEAGIETVETDLGEFIVQLDRDAPSHIVAPMIHKDRRSVARAFERSLGAEYTEDPERLTAIARRHMRGLFHRADLGVSGANFLVAETGSIVLCTNEGNADLVTSVPPLHVAVAGVEKLVPTTRHLVPLIKLLARSATGQDLTVYTTLVHGPRRPGEHDGPREVHVVLLDNGRSRVLRPATRPLLRCVRCGACLNACPVYRAVGGGHAYGAVYSGPIGAALTPLLRGLENYSDLPRASSLCGACFEACPVRIDIPRQLLQLRRELVDGNLAPLRQRLLFRAWAFTLRSPRRYRGASGLLRVLGRTIAASRGREEWLRRLPWPVSGWTAQRDFPAPAAESFRGWWRRHRREAPR
jgi:L-lactate dehydrogenase complex protein LldF